MIDEDVVTRAPYFKLLLFVDWTIRQRGFRGWVPASSAEEDVDLVEVSDLVANQVNYPSPAFDAKRFASSVMDSNSRVSGGFSTCVAHIV